MTILHGEVIFCYITAPGGSVGFVLRGGEAGAGWVEDDGEMLRGKVKCPPEGGRHIRPTLSSNFSVRAFTRTWAIASGLPSTL